MSIREMTPVEVAARLESDEHAVYLDVRSEDEFETGHPAGALNVPIFHFDPATKKPTPNHQFLAVVLGTISPDAAIYIGCSNGRISFQAANLMKAAGYENLVNVDGGYSGKHDPLGKVVQEGWVQCDLPVGSGDGDDRSYSHLLEVAAENQEEE